MYFLLICLLISCSSFSFKKSDKSIEGLTFEEYSIKVYHSLKNREDIGCPMLKQIKDNLNFQMKKEDFFSQMIEFKEQVEDEAEKFILYNWLLFHCLDREISYRLEIVEFVKENGLKYVTDGEEGYNLLHIAVFFKDSEMFKKYFNEKDLYSTGSGRDNNPRCNPILYLFLFNYEQEAKILEFLQNIYSCLDKEQIEKLGILQLACRFGMCDIVDYLVEKGINTESRLKIEIPPIESSIHTEEQLSTLKKHNLSISGYGLAFNLFNYFVNKECYADPLRIMLSPKIILENEDEIDWNLSDPDDNSMEAVNFFSSAYLHVQNSLRIQVLNVIYEPKKEYKDIKEMIENIPKHFSAPLDPSQKEKEENIIYDFLNLTLLNKTEYDEEKEIDVDFVMKDLFKNTLLTDTDDISLEEEFESIVEITKDIGADIQLRKKMTYKFMNEVCDFLNENSLKNNKECFNRIFKIEKKDIIDLIKEGHFGAARSLIRFPKEFGIEKNKSFVNEEKKKGIKRVDIQKTWLDKIIALKQEDINKEELEETISLARDKGWMTSEEVAEIQIFENKKKKKEKERKKGQAFKELLEYNEEQKKQKLEEEKRKKELEDKLKIEKRREQKETKSEEDRATSDYVEERVNYFELDEKEANKKFEELVMSENKEELVVLMNKVGKKIDRSFEIVKAQDERVRQLLIIRGFIVNRELVLSILEKNQKKAMKTLLREVTKEVREIIFDFSEEDMKIEITKKMQEIMGIYSKGFKVIKEEIVDIDEEIKIEINDKFNKLFVHNKIVQLFYKDSSDNENKEFYNVKDVKQEIDDLNKGRSKNDHDMKPDYSFRNLRVSDKRVYYYREEDSMKILEYNINKNQNKETPDFLKAIEARKNDSKPNEYTEIKEYFK